MICILDEASEFDGKPFDLVLVGLGYEKRARWIVSEHNITGDTKVALRFGYSEVLSFDDNIEYFTRNGFQVRNGVDDSVIDFISSKISFFDATKDDYVRVFVDISAMSRLMIANVILGIEKASVSRDVRVWACYAPAEYIAPANTAPLLRAEPVRKEFSGWTGRPDAPVSTVINLGYEESLAIGALQYIDPQRVWAFVPVGDDRRYLVDVERANAVVVDYYEAATVKYALDDPYRLKRRIEEIARIALVTSRLIIIPLGPKLFSWMAMLVARSDASGDVSVWRFSPHDSGNPVDRQAAGRLITYSCLFTYDGPAADAVSDRC